MATFSSVAVRLIAPSSSRRAHCHLGTARPFQRRAHPREGVRQVWDIDPAYPFTVVDVRVPLVGAMLFLFGSTMKSFIASQSSTPRRCNHECNLSPPPKKWPPLIPEKWPAIDRERIARALDLVNSRAVPHGKKRRDRQPHPAIMGRSDPSTRKRAGTRPPWFVHLRRHKKRAISASTV